MYRTLTTARIVTPAPSAPGAEEKETRRGQMGFLERWLFWASGNALRNRFRRHLLLVYLLVLHGLLIVLPGGGRGRTLGFGAGSGSDVAGGLMP